MSVSVVGNIASDLVVCLITATLDRVIGISRHSVVATVTVTPRDSVGGGVDVTFDPTVELRSEEERQALSNAVESTLQQGIAEVCATEHGSVNAFAQGPFWDSQCKM